MTSNGRAPAGRYSESEIQAGLEALAYFTGNSRRAATFLARHGTPIPRSTLKDWPERYSELYRRAREAVQKAVESEQAERHQALIREGLEVSEQLLTRVRAEMGSMNASQAAKALRDVHVSVGISTDKAADLLGRPARPPSGGSQDLTAALKALNTRYPQWFGDIPKELLVESTAHEVND